MTALVVVAMVILLATVGGMWVGLVLWTALRPRYRFNGPVDHEVAAVARLKAKRRQR